MVGEIVGYVYVVVSENDQKQYFMTSPQKFTTDINDVKKYSTPGPAKGIATWTNKNTKHKVRVLELALLSNGVFK